MTQYDNTNRGVLFDNDRKETDNHPDMTGSININGVDHWFSGWWKDGSKGEFLSLSIGKPKDARQAPQQARQAPAPERRGNRPSMQQRPQQRGPKLNMAIDQATGFDDLDSDIPF